jgi:hypothetical protein
MGFCAQSPPGPDLTVWWWWCSKSPMIMVEDLKKMMAEKGPSSSTRPVAEVQSPLSTISSIMKNSPGGNRLIAHWIKVLENEESHDAN